MICKNCGSELDENSKFCIKCGSAVDENNTHDTNYQNTCKSCGSELKENSKFCTNCGAATEDTASETVIDNAPAQVSEENKNLTGKEAALGRFLVFLPRILVIIGIICFFFPFMTVSCADNEVSVSGTDMIFGDDDVSVQVSSHTDDDSLFNWFILLAGLCAIGGLIHPKDAGGASIFLLIFRFTAKWYYDLDEIEEQFGSVLEVDFGFALWLAIIVFLLASGVSRLLDGKNDKGDTGGT